MSILEKEGRALHYLKEIYAALSILKCWREKVQQKLETIKVTTKKKSKVSPVVKDVETFP